MSTNAAEASTDSPPEPKPSNGNAPTAAASAGDATVVVEHGRVEDKTKRAADDDAAEAGVPVEPAKRKQSK